MTLSRYFGMPDVLLTSSGSAAIIVALKANEIPQGSEVIIPASCCPIVLFTLQLAGYKPVLADVEVATLNCSAANIAARLNDKTGAILAVHGYGGPCDIEAIMQLGKLHGVTVIEDACLAYGGMLNGIPLGGIADTTVLSFGYDKPIAFGYGGAVLFRDQGAATRALAYLNENTLLRFCQHQDVSVLHELFLQLPEFTQQRLENILLVKQTINTPLFSHPEAQPDTPFWRYPLLMTIDRRDDFINYARQREMVFTTHYQSLGALMTMSDVDNADFIAKRVINLFVRAETRPQQLLDMIDIVNEYRYES
ncbi:DegT/DnrJ/EryC1/StrS family aminotransferase [Pseudoalteromonas viridis]|uniref:DegT/DnrJ/EryC1/StrS family aminotransferase n=1 Tax=Pseudoalteromonas viridis TaxID=339617 RepID=UPI001FFDF29F|nr:DegT/DnrJ/EryC1/StrS family aminotransferase [Pseudoalteromonas viridis]